MAATAASHRIDARRDGVALVDAKALHRELIDARIGHQLYADACRHVVSVLVLDATRHDDVASMLDEHWTGRALDVKRKQLDKPDADDEPPPGAARFYAGATFCTGDDAAARA